MSADDIDRLLALDTDRVATITRLVETINRLTTLDQQRVAQILELEERFRSMDGMSITGRNLAFLEDPVFKAAWAASYEANKESWKSGVPDVRWRAHIALWAAEQGLRLEGDFVECGVHTGLLSLVICHALQFDKLPRRFYLFDTFDGIPDEDMNDIEQHRIKTVGALDYKNVWGLAKRNFAPFPNAQLVQGRLPKSLETVVVEKIAYLSVDLNNVKAERGVIAQLWEKVVPGAIVLIDDYAWIGCEQQQQMWDTFARAHGLSIATLPTGQGLLIKQ
jgi:O-methyltransferase